jgi:hypothetical protein
MLPKLVDDVVNMSLKLHEKGKDNGRESVDKFIEEGEIEKLKLKYNILYKE